jgi:hypothetical protein
MNTIHVFAYGEAQIIGKDLNFKADVSKFTKLQAVIDDVKSKRPADVEEKDYHAINIFNKMKVSYNSKERKGNFSFKFEDLDSAKLNDLINEFATLKANS